MFIKELSLYINWLKTKIEETEKPWTDKQKEHFETFRDNIADGIRYYKELFTNMKSSVSQSGNRCLEDLEKYRVQLAKLMI